MWYTAHQETRHCGLLSGLRRAVLCRGAHAGNMTAAGLLQQPSRTVFLELGAGKAWLTAWLHMLNPITKDFILLDKFAAFNNKVGPVGTSKLL